MNTLPNHVAIIPDGNRRWAVQKGLPTLIGHKKGFDAATKVIRHLRKKGIHTTTLWGFSTENWDRSKIEIDYLMKIYEQAVDSHLKEALKEEVRLVHLGRKDRLPDSLVKKIQNAEEKTKHFNTYVLNIAIDYGGHDELVRGVQALLKKGGDPSAISVDTFNDILDTRGQAYPNPDIVVRTGGEMRLSGFLSWQIAYSELFFIEKHLPDLTPEDMDAIINEYMTGRERRFGGNGVVMQGYDRITE